MGYLETLNADERFATLTPFMDIGFPALIVTADRDPPTELIQLCENAGVSLICTPLESTIAVDRINRSLRSWLSPRQVRHAVLLDVHGVGVLSSARAELVE